MALYLLPQAPWSFQPSPIIVTLPTAPILKHASSAPLLSIPPPPILKSINNSPSVTLQAAQTFKSINNTPSVTLQSAQTFKSINNTPSVTLQSAQTFQPVNNTPSVTLQSTQTYKPVNDIRLTRKVLQQVLSDLSERLYRSFRRQVRLVVHGGAVMVLHPSFSHREFTQDVDYIHRSFVSEYRALGFQDAEQRLRACIAETACQFNLGADWMNDHADVALPWAYECVQLTFLPP